MANGSSGAISDVRHKKGSMHFEWLDLDLWGKFNQRIAKIKGYPLFEAKEQTAYQKRNAGASGNDQSKSSESYSSTRTELTDDVKEQIRKRFTQLETA